MKFKTKRDAAQAWIRQDWNTIQSEYLDHNKLSCYKLVDDDESVEDFDGYYDIGQPMWGYWFQPKDSADLDKLNDLADEVANLGFVLIIDDEYQSVWGLGIDGAGFDFYESYWIPLYDLFGFRWHAKHAEDEDE